MRVCFLRNSLSFTIQTQFYLIFCSNPRHSNYMQIVQSIEKHLLYTRSSRPKTKPFSSNNNVVAFILYAFPSLVSLPLPLCLCLSSSSLSLFLSIHLSSHLSIHLQGVQEILYFFHNSLQPIPRLRRCKSSTECECIVIPIGW